MDYVEIIGICATVFILISMSINTQTWKGDVWMRIVNIIGSIIFTVYGFLLPAYSTGVLNVLLVFINIFHLTKLFLSKNREQSSNNKKNEKIDIEELQNKKSVKD